MSARVKLPCAQCEKGRGMSFVPYDEVQFRVDDDGCFVCWQHCKAIRWGCEHCKNCSDRALCAGEFATEFKTFVENEVKGVG